MTESSMGPAVKCVPISSPSHTASDYSLSQLSESQASCSMRPRSASSFSVLEQRLVSSSILLFTGVSIVFSALQIVWTTHGDQ